MFGELFVGKNSTAVIFFSGKKYGCVVFFFYYACGIFYLTDAHPPGTYQNHQKYQ